MTLLQRCRRVSIALFTLLFLLFMVVWLLSPFVLRSVLNQQLEPYALTLSARSEIRFNPFRVALSLRNIELNHSNGTQTTLTNAKFALSPSALLNKQLKISTFTLEGLQLPTVLTQDSLLVAGVDLLNLPQKGDATTAPQQNSSEAQLSEQYSLRLPNAMIDDVSIDIDYHGAAMRYHIDSLSLQDGLFSSLRQQGKLALASQLNERAISVNSQFSNSHERGDVGVSVKADKLDLGLLSALGIEGLSVIDGSNTIDLSAAFTSQDQWQTVNATLDKLQFELNDVHAEYDGLALALEKLLLSSEGHGALQPNSDDQLKAIVNADLSLQAVSLTAAESGDTLAAFESFALESIAAGHKNQQAQLTIDNLLLTHFIGSHKHDGEPLLILDSLRLHTLETNTERVNIEQLTIGRFTSHIDLNTNGEIAQLVRLPASAQQTSQSDSEDSDTTTTEPASVFSLQIGEIALLSPGHIHFSDQNTQPAFSEQFELQRLQLANIDTASSTEQAELDLLLRSGEYARFTLQGTTTLDPNAINGALNATIEEWDLHTYSAYVYTALGVVIRAGQLDQNLTLNINNSVLNGSSDINVRGLKLDAQEPINAAALANGTALSLNSALSVLQDKHGDLRLEVPISGDVNSPNFGANGFAKLLLQKAALRTAKSYLIDTFIPYAQVVKLANTAGSHLLKLRFEPLVYDPSVSSYTDSQLQFIEQLAQLLNDNEKQQLQMCPVIPNTAKEAPAAAAQHAEKLKQLLVDQYQIASARLLLCTPKIDTTDAAQHRIEFDFR